MNNAVRLMTQDEGSPHENPDIWHLVDPANDRGPATLCTAEFFGPGESGCRYEVQLAKPGVVGCPDCIRKIKIYKAVKL